MLDYSLCDGGEIILRPNSFCNLTEVVCRPEDTLDTLKRKVRLATILGTIQSTLTDFRYLRPIWKRNCEDERLLGVSLTGIMDCPFIFGAGGVLEILKQTAVDVNKEFAERLGINPSAAITTVKPSGTVSQLVGSSSGIHPSYSEFYVRTVRFDSRDPICGLMTAAGIPHEPDVTNSATTVFSFPQKAPEGSITRNNIDALSQLKLYQLFKRSWCEHNVSCTVYVKEEEWMRVGAWVYDNWDDVIGLTFLPYSDHIYKQAPYQEITEEQYMALVAKMPTHIRWEDLIENTDNTIGSQELACTSGACEIR